MFDIFPFKKHLMKNKVAGENIMFRMYDTKFKNGSNNEMYLKIIAI